MATDSSNGAEPVEIVEDATIRGIKHYCVLLKGENFEDFVWLKENQIEDPQLIQQYLIKKKNKSRSGARLKERGM